MHIFTCAPFYPFFKYFHNFISSHVSQSVTVLSGPAQPRPRPAVAASKLLYNCLRGEPECIGLHLTITHFTEDYRAELMRCTIKRG